MTKIQSRCPMPKCGDVILPSEEIWILDTEEQYAFTCPKCGQGQVKNGDRRIIELLLGAGVQFEGEIVEDAVRRIPSWV